MTKLYHSCGGFILVRTFEDCAEYVYFSNSERQVLRVGVFANAELEKYKYPTKELRTCMAAFEENRLFSTAAEVSLAMTEEMLYLGISEKLFRSRKFRNRIFISSTTDEIGVSCCCPAPILLLHVGHH